MSLWEMKTNLESLDIDDVCCIELVVINEGGLPGTPTGRASRRDSNIILFYSSIPLK